MLRKLRHSLFAKLTLIVLTAAATVIVILVVAIGEGLEQGSAHQWRRHSAELVRFAAERIFESPSAAAIDDVAARLGLQIRYQGPNLAHATDPQLPNFNEVRPLRHHRHHGRGWRNRDWRHDMEDSRGAVFIGIHGGVLYLVHLRPPHRILMVTTEELYEVDALGAGFVIAAALAALVALFVGVHFFIRKTLSPLSELDANIAAVGRGEWREMKTARGDEIGKLARGFNRMQLQLREMFAARERLLAGISHELRTPLARMKVAVEFVRDRRIQKRLREDIDELDSLTGDLLESARLASAHGDLQTAPCIAADLAHETLAQVDAESQQYIRVNDESDGAVINADARRLKRALRNIIDNSLKYSELAPQSVSVTVARAAARVTITVQDRGRGLAPADLQRIFDAFYRADPARARADAGAGGYGLGMGLCRAIVEAHRGTVTAASAPGEGVTVTIELPAAEAKRA